MASSQVKGYKEVPTLLALISKMVWKVISFVFFLFIDIIQGHTKGKFILENSLLNKEIFRNVDK